MSVPDHLIEPPDEYAPCEHGRKPGYCEDCRREAHEDDED